MTLTEFIAKWRDSGGAERANKDSFLNDLCDALDVDRPRPTTGEWPSALPQQLSELRAVMFGDIARTNAKALTKHFSGAKRKEIEMALESLEALGIVVSSGEGDQKVWTALRPAAHQRPPAPPRLAP